MRASTTPSARSTPPVGPDSPDIPPCGLELPLADGPPSIGVALGAHGHLRRVIRYRIRNVDNGSHMHVCEAYNELLKACYNLNVQYV